MKTELEQAFGTLGVPVGAPASDVKTAYRTLIRSHHPDHVAGDRSVANDRLAEINAAKDLIDRTPAPLRDRPRRAETAQRTPEQERAHREQQARAFRKAMEARSNAETDAERLAREADERTAQSQEQAERQAAVRRTQEETRLRRQAAFAAAVSGRSSVASPGSLFGKLRSLGAR